MSLISIILILQKLLILGVCYGIQILQRIINGKWGVKRIIKIITPKKVRIKTKQKLVKKFTSRAPEIDKDIRKNCFLF